MRNFTDYVNEAKQPLEIQDKTINYINVSDLKKYLEIADKFISEDTKAICQWLIDNNSTYVKDFGGENALKTFYDKGIPKEEHLKELYKLMGKTIKAGQLLQIPVFQTEEQFKAIISKEISPDEILLDLTTERGRNKVATKFTPLAHKIAHSQFGKSNLSYEDLFASALEGLTYAMNTYGKKNDKSNADDEAVKSYTFKQYAGYCMRNHILGQVDNESRTVRVPKSQLKKEKDTTGRISKNNTTSGEQVVGHDKDGNGKTLFDYIGDTENAGKNLDKEDINKLWSRIETLIKEKFDKKVLDIFYAATGTFGHEKEKKQDIAKKYNVSKSNITYYIFKVKEFLTKDPKASKLIGELNELMHECRHDWDQEENDDIYVVDNLKNNNDAFESADHGDI